MILSISKNGASHHWKVSLLHRTKGSDSSEGKDVFYKNAKPNYR